MEIIIDDSIKLRDLQKQFSKQYPYLKIEFFSKPHGHQKASQKNDMLNRELTIGKARTIHNAGMMSIHASQTISELERDFQETFGLPVQVFRKSGKAWIETTNTDDEPIKKLNRTAKLQNETAVPNQIIEWNPED